MTAFTTFAVLYMTALFLELAEKWSYPLFTFATLLLLIIIVTTRITRVTFLIFLAVTTSHFLLVQFPDVANHVNIAIYCNVVLMIGIVYSLVRRKRWTDDDYFEMIRPVLQVTAILVYFMAGFHKLNRDFFNPDVSCVGDMTNSLAKLATSQIAGIPLGLGALAAVFALAYRRASSSSTRRYLLAAAGVGVLMGLLILGMASAISRFPWATLVVAMSLIVIAWELIGGPMLAIPRLQPVMLAFSWTMHSTLTFLGFVDFASLALALLFLFVPRPYVGLVTNPVAVPVIRRSLHRAHLYLAINVLTGVSVLVGVDSRLFHRLVTGLLFNLAALALIWPLFSSLAAGARRPHWSGVPLSSRMTPSWMFVFPVLLLLHGMTSYLGLRTAGNFSMFSNLRTEGPASNHFILGSNPLKSWSYQEDVVRFIDIDDRQARIGYQYQALRGNQLPVVEFRKLIYAWTVAGAAIPMTFEYQGKRYETEDIAKDPVWRTDRRDWEMALMDFRVIQPNGANECRW